MINYRNGLFETNSSSSHSLVVSNKDMGFNYNLPVDDSGTLKIQFNEYSWGPDILKTPYDKICYWVTDHLCQIRVTNVSGDIDWRSVQKELKDNLDIKRLVSVIKNSCPYVKNIEFNFDAYCVFGIIDHESVGTTSCIYSESDIKDFIFGNNNIVIIDNDNNNYFDKCDIESLFEISEDNKSDFIENLIKEAEEKYRKLREYYDRNKEGCV